MITSSALLFLSLINTYSFTWQGWDARNPAFSDTSFTYVISGRATAGSLNTYSFDPFPFSVQYRSQLLRRGTPFGARLDFGVADPFYGSQGLYARSLYGYYRVEVAGTLEARAGFIPLPFQGDWARPFFLRSAALDYRGVSVMQSGLAYYDIPVDFVPAGGLGVAVEHRFPFGLEVAAGYSFLPSALYYRAAYQYTKGDVFFRPEVSGLIFDISDKEFDINNQSATSGEPASIKTDASGMSLFNAGILAGVGDLFFEGRFGLFSFNTDDLQEAAGLSGYWVQGGGGFIIKGKGHKFLQSLVLRGDLSYRATDRDGEANFYISLTASAVILRNFEVSASYAVRFPEQENEDPKGYIYLGIGYTHALQF